MLKNQKVMRIEQMLISDDVLIIKKFNTKNQLIFISGFYCIVEDDDLYNNHKKIYDDERSCMMDIYFRLKESNADKTEIEILERMMDIDGMANQEF